MAKLTGKVQTPNIGVVPDYPRVTIELYTGTAGIAFANGAEIIDIATLTVDNGGISTDGRWAATLTPNSGITLPTGTKYRVSYYGEGTLLAQEWITFPGDGLDHPIGECLDEAPGSLGESGAFSGREIGYAQTEAVFSGTSLTPAYSPALLVTVTVGLRPIDIRFSCSSIYNNASGGVLVYLLEDGTVATTLAVHLPATTGRIPMERTVRRQPAPGAHTYQIGVGIFTGGTAFLDAATGRETSIAVIER